MQELPSRRKVGFLNSRECGESVEERGRRAAGMGVGGVFGVSVFPGPSKQCDGVDGVGGKIAGHLQRKMGCRKGTKDLHLSKRKPRKESLVEDMIQHLGQGLEPLYN